MEPLKERGRDDDDESAGFFSSLSLSFLSLVSANNRKGRDDDVPLSGVFNFFFSFSSLHPPPGSWKLLNLL